MNERTVRPLGDAREPQALGSVLGLDFGAGDEDARGWIERNGPSTGRVLIQDGQLVGLASEAFGIRAAWSGGAVIMIVVSLVVYLRMPPRSEAEAEAAAERAVHTTEECPVVTTGPSRAVSGGGVAPVLLRLPAGVRAAGSHDEIS